MTEFQEKLRQQHEESMHRELEALVQTAGPAQAEVSSRGNKPTRNTAVEKVEEDEEEGIWGSQYVTICCRWLHSENKYLMRWCYRAVRSLWRDGRPATLRTHTLTRTHAHTYEV